MEHLTNSEIFQINRMEAHSDHKYFSSLEEMTIGKMNFRKSLNGTWKFSFAKNLHSRIKEFYEEDFDYSGWGNITVPGHIQLQGYDAPHYVNTMYPWDGHENILPPQVPSEYNPVGSYIRTFEVPKNWDKDRVFISFQGVESAFNLWVNGKFVGYSEDTFTPSEFDISPYLVEGENKIAVEVIKWCSGSWIEDQDFWRLSGIFRDVYLFSYPQVHINDIFVKTELDNEYKNSNLSLEIKLDNRASKEVEIYFELFDKENKLVTSSAINRTNENECYLSKEVSNVNLWSAENPYLYKLVVYVKENNQIIEVIPQTVGFRKFEMINKVMHINGKRIVFKGVNRHEFNCYHGRSVKEEDMLWDIKFLKQHNLNSVRTSHYPNNSRWYELCDQYGIYLIDEANLESHGSWQKMGQCKPDWVIPGDKPEWCEVVLDRAKSMVERDKNHPSILIWSCGNEAFGGENIYKMSEYFRTKDNSRLVHYEGIFWDRRFNDTSDMESRMYAKVEDIEAYLNDNPTKPFISCEYTHSMGNSNGNMHKYTELEDKYPMYQGGFIWDYIDQGIMTKDRFGKEFLAYGGDFGDRPTDYNFCFNGIVLANRKPSPKIQEVKYLFSNFKLYPKKNEVLIKNESLFTNANEYDLKYSVKKDGKTIFTNKIVADVEPLSSKTIVLNLPEFCEGGEYIVETALELRTETIWACKNHEISCGQYVYEVAVVKEEIELKELVIENSDVNLGVKGDNFHFIFSKAQGKLVSIKYGNKEFINVPPVPNFWRAPVDNDKGNMMAQRYAQWKLASFYAIPTNMEIKEESKKITIIYTYDLNTTPKVYAKITYTVNSLGKISVKVSYDGVENISMMPAFGLTMKIPAEYENLTWYGNGPDENYSDRKHGARLGIFNNKVVDNVSPYSKPQECGNKTDVRWFTVSDSTGNGLKISAKSTIEFSALPYTSHELENASHHYDLPNIHNTVLTINKVQMGVGGDDSWGAPTHSEYLIPSDKPLEFEFCIEAFNIV